MNFKSERLPIGFLLYIFLLTQGVFFIKFISILMLPFLLRNQIFDKRNGSYFFYIVIFLLGFSVTLYNLMFGFIDEKGLIIALFALFFWILGLVNLIYITNWVKKSSKENIVWVIDNLFFINTILCIIQFFLLVIEYKTINPFTSELGTSAGDFIIGYFANSSVNMVVLAFFFSYYMFINVNFWKAFICIFFLLLTTYMSGILLFLVSIGIYTLLIKRASFSRRFLYIGSILLALSIFFLISYNNVEYAFGILSLVFEINPPRKIVSFIQTFELITSNYGYLFFGTGPGMFSSRAAFIGGGEYVSWYPSSLLWKSELFSINHFELWNYDVLSIDFNDGTANQPFSLYNQLLGEYGLFGILSFFLFYIRSFYLKSLNKNLSFLFILYLFLFMFLDYWFEYLSTIVYFELFSIILSTNKVSNKLNETNTVYRTVPSPS